MDDDKTHLSDRTFSYIFITATVVAMNAVYVFPDLWAKFISGVLVIAIASGFLRSRLHRNRSDGARLAALGETARTRRTANQPRR